MFEFTESTFFWALINFSILLFILHKFAWKPLYKQIQEAEDKKLDMMAELESNLANSQLLANQYQEKLDNIHIEAKKILHEAMLKTEELRKVEIKKLQDERQKVLDSAHDVLTLEKKRFFKQAKETLADVIISVSEKVIRKELKPNDHQTLIAENIASFQQHIGNYEQKTTN